MLGIPLDLGRASGVALDQDAGRDAAQRDDGGEEEGLARNDLFGGLGIGDDLVAGLAGAGGETCQRQRGPHQLQEPATADRVEPLRGVLGELVLDELLERGRVGQLFETPPVGGSPRLRQALADGVEIQISPSGRVVHGHR